MFDSKLENTLKNTNVLFIDDEEYALEAMKGILPHIFNECYFALNGEKGYSIVMNNDIDLIITDLYMPKLNGLELADKIEKFTEKEIKMIFVSGNSESEFKDKLKENNYELITKPINSNDLFDSLSKYFS